MKQKIPNRWYHTVGLPIYVCYSCQHNSMYFLLITEEAPKGKQNKKKRPREVDPVEKKKKKKARFDPSLPQTVTQIQEKLLETEQQTKSNEGMFTY